MLSRKRCDPFQPSELSVQFAARTVELAKVVDGERLTLLRAFATVPRHLFLESALATRAYEDHALPIGFGQTISKPSTVALMLANLGLRPGERVLEIGAGSGYVLALLAALGTQVFGVEKVSDLARLARRRCDALGLQQVLIKSGDGKKGWSDMAPFDAIIISAAFPEVPEALFEQLAPGGRLVAPIIESNPADRRFPHRLTLWSSVSGNRSNAPLYEKRDLGACHFVLGA